MLRLMSDDHPLSCGGNGCGCVGGVYAHGELERVLGSDLLIAQNWLSVLPGVWRAEVEDEHGLIWRCLAFVWRTRYGVKGLVVSPTDSESVADVMEYHSQRLEII